jgi:mono/diheme cytochrome c family protein
MARNVLGGALVVLLAASATAGDVSKTQGLDGMPQGYRNLIEHVYVHGGGMNQETFDNLWRTWEEPLKSEAEKATPEKRRQMTLSRYGLTDAPGREGGVPLQYAADSSGNWSTNCFTCHGGKVAGQIIPGLPNTHIALQTITEEAVQTRILMGEKISQLEATSLFVPLGGSNGTTNAIIFGVVLAAFRDEDLNVDTNKPVPKLIHNDHDAPPWWNVKHKKYLYADGFAGKGHRALMQFMMAPSNGPEAFHNAEADYKQIYDWIEGLEAPKYPFAIDRDLAKKGEAIFNRTCSECHGTYEDPKQYAFPEKIVPIEVVGTDRARLDSLTPVMRASYEASWFSNHGEKKSIADPGGYVAQPLWGIWASAPYLHNGSVPTLWHLFHADKRPVVWQRTEDGYDSAKVGLEVREYDGLPEGIKTAKQKRTVFDTRLFAKSAQGHLFPEELNEDEKVAVIEYLKTL